MVFRDHRLSDLIGFSYSGMKATEAATDLVKQGFWQYANLANALLWRHLICR